MTASKTATGKRILVVDDDDIFLERIRRNLRRSDWEFAGFVDAGAALDSLRAAAGTDVLIADNRMPAMDGPEFVEIVHGDAAIRVVRTFVASAAQPPGDVVARVESAGARFVLKDVLAEKGDLLALLDGIAPG